MLLETILNQVARHQHFVYEGAKFNEDRTRITVGIRAREGSKSICSKCNRPGPVHSHLEQRTFQFLPLWGIFVYFTYTMRRVNCATCGVTVERVPWAMGKSPITTHLALHMANWAKKISWQEVADFFQVGWDQVHAAVDWVVSHGMRHREMSGITALGIDEMHFGRFGEFYTLVYQIDAGCRRLLWMGEGHGEQTLATFFDFFGAVRTQAIQYICTDMWAAYLKVIREKCSHALNILDPFHIIGNVTKALDQIRRDEVAHLQACGKEPVLSKKRWILLKWRSNLKAGQRAGLKSLLSFNLKSVKAYLLKEDFRRLWEFKSPECAGGFMDNWIKDVMRHRSLQPLRRFAGTLRRHRELVLNYFRAGKELTSASVECLNGQARACVNRSRGFRYAETRRLALFHSLGKLPEPVLSYRFYG